jgi:predicted NUDIX family NTP pyrophosphohydrolase
MSSLNLCKFKCGHCAQNDSSSRHGGHYCRKCGLINGHRSYDCDGSGPHCTLYKGGRCTPCQKNNSDYKYGGHKCCHCGAINLHLSKNCPQHTQNITLCTLYKGGRCTPCQKNNSDYKYGGHKCCHCGAINLHLSKNCPQRPEEKECSDTITAFSHKPRPRPSVYWKTNKKRVSGVLLVKSNGKFLVQYRGQNVSSPNMFGAPGGSAEAGETPLKTALRETREETGIVLSENYVRYFQFETTNHEFVIFLFKSTEIIEVKKVSSQHKWEVQPYSSHTMARVNGKEVFGHYWKGVSELQNLGSKVHGITMRTIRNSLKYL